MTTYTADRKGHVTENDSFQDRFLEKMYGSAIGRALLKPLVNPVLSEIGGRILDSRVSALAVPAFIRHTGIGRTMIFLPDRFERVPEKLIWYRKLLSVPATAG